MVGLPLSWLLYAPLGGWATLPRMLDERALCGVSLHHVVYRLLVERGVDKELIRRLTVRWPTLLFAAGSVAVAGAVVGWRKAGAEELAASDMRIFWRGATARNLFYLLLGELLVSGVVCTVGAGACDAAALKAVSRGKVLPWLCWGVLCSNVVGSYLPLLEPRPFTYTGRVALAVMVIWVPAGVAALVVVSRQRWRRLRARCSGLALLKIVVDRAF